MLGKVLKQKKKKTNAHFDGFILKMSGRMAIESCASSSSIQFINGNMEIGMEIKADIQFGKKMENLFNSTKEDVKL